MCARRANSLRRRHDRLRHTAGLNSEVFDALLTCDMDEGSQERLLRLSFSEQEAAELSSPHTQNFV